jgi:mono/diheme cytochrome c family protein
MAHLEEARMEAMKVPATLAMIAALGTFAMCGCSRSHAGSGTGAPLATFLELSVSKRPTRVAADSLAQGKQLYEANCVQCHGAKGDGSGFGAPFLVPPPRDFTTGEFKFRTTESGALPTDEDLFRTISRGASGTGMPPWQFLLTADERWALVDYVKTFSTKFARFGAPEPAKLAPDPPKSADAGRGKRVYVDMKCSSCHGDEGRGDGPSALTLVDSHQRRINARDFTKPGSFRTGWSLREIVRTFDTGLNGTPMPSYAEVMSTQEKYDLAAYVMSLAGPGAGDQRRQIAHGMDGVGAPSRVIRLREHAWQYEPSEIRIKRGEVVKIEFQTTDNGLGAGHGFAIDGYDREIFMNGAMVGSPLSVTFKIDEPGRYKYYCATQCSTRELHPRMTGLLVVE